MMSAVGESPALEAVTSEVNERLRRAINMGTIDRIIRTVPVIPVSVLYLRDKSAERLQSF